MSVHKKKINEFDPSGEEVIIISGSKKEALTKEILFEEKPIVVTANVSEGSYFIFGLLEIENRFGINSEKMILLLYLKELGIFSLQLKILHRTFRIGDFNNLIEQDFSRRGKTLYRLSMDGIKVIDEFNKIMSDNSKYLLANRHTDLDVDSAVSAKLAGYFS
tara:strand:- start:347 stop:832 length:486 start_codon:yes stop_codon:yes gene_type:complete